MLASDLATALLLPDANFLGVESMMGSDLLSMKPATGAGASACPSWQAVPDYSATSPQAREDCGNSWFVFQKVYSNVKENLIPKPPNSRGMIFSGLWSNLAVLAAPSHIIVLTPTPHSGRITRRCLQASPGHLTTSCLPTILPSRLAPGPRFRRVTQSPASLLAQITLLVHNSPRNKDHFHLIFFTLAMCRHPVTRHDTVPAILYFPGKIPSGTMDVKITKKASSRGSAPSHANQGKEDLDWGALERESDTSLQCIILLDDHARELSTWPTFDQFYALCSRFFAIARRSLRDWLAKVIKEGFVLAQRPGTTTVGREITYELSASGKSAADIARNIGNQRLQSWNETFTIQNHLRRGLSDEKSK